MVVNCCFSQGTTRSLTSSISLRITFAINKADKGCMALTQMWRLWSTRPVVTTAHPFGGGGGELVSFGDHASTNTSSESLSCWLKSIGSSTSRSRFLSHKLHASCRKPIDYASRLHPSPVFHRLVPFYFLSYFYKWDEIWKQPFAE